MQSQELPAIRITPKLNPKQKEAMRILISSTNPVQELCYGGGAGGGKSYLGCTWLIAMSNKYAGSRWMIGGKELRKLKQGTMETFFKACKDFGIQEGAHYQYSEMKGEVTWSNGSKIILMDLADRKSDPQCEYLGSTEYTGGFLDECSRFSVTTKNMVMSRMRWKNDEFGIPPRLLLTCNPSRDWLYNNFYKPFIDGNLEPHRGFIQALVSDNPQISKHYVTSLSRLDEIGKARLLYGSWDYQDSSALFNYDALVKAFDFPDDYDFAFNVEARKDIDKIFSIDVAHLGQDKTAIFVWEGLNVVHIEELTKQTFPQQQAAIQILQYKYGVTNDKIIMDLDGLSAGLHDLIGGCKGIHNNAKALYGADFMNIKTQLYFKLADMINTNQIKIRCTEDQQTRLTQELQVLKREKVDSDGKIQMTSKDAVKKMIGRSPDLSDAMMFRMFWVLSTQAFDYSFYVI